MIYTIKKGSHYSNRIFDKIFSFLYTNDKIGYYVIFNETSKYIDNSEDKYDVNKLFGFSLGLHHKNSHRFGWNFYDNKIHIYAYSYVNSERIIKEICTVNMDEEYKFLIRTKNGKCIFSVIDSEYNIKQVTVNFTTRKILGYCLWPYFGGNKTAPKNISIELNKI